MPLFLRSSLLSHLFNNHLPAPTSVLADYIDMTLHSKLSPRTPRVFSPSWTYPQTQREKTWIREFLLAILQAFTNGKGWNWIEMEGLRQQTCWSECLFSFFPSLPLSSSCFGTTSFTHCLIPAPDFAHCLFAALCHFVLSVTKRKRKAVYYLKYLTFTELLEVSS